MSRSGEPWIEETGGFRFGESPEQFEHRVRAIEALTKKLKSGNSTGKDRQLLCGLKGLARLSQSRVTFSQVRAVNIGLDALPK